MNNSLITWETGELAVDGFAIKLSPTLTHAEFANSDLGRNSHIAVRNDPYRLYVTPVVRMRGGEFRIGVQFRGETLTELRIVCVVCEFGESWAEWSEEKERARKHFHDKIVASFPDRHSNWGNIASVFDERTGESAIVVKYEANKDLR